MLDAWISWLALLGPLALVLAGLWPWHGADDRPRPMARRAEAAAAAALVTALATLAAWATLGVRAHAAAGVVYIDALSAVMLTLVSFVGSVVIRYSRNYLDGDPQQVRFFRLLCLTLASVLTLIVSGNLLLFAAAWISTSLGLHQLLLFYADRPAARLAARKKFLVSRLGDICLIGALALIWRSFGAIDFATILPAAKGLSAAGLIPAASPWIAVLLAAGALLKSAQLPFHGWLLEVMETPTPVSALLHAGIINAGGFLVLRFGDVIALSVPSLDLLAIVGGLTALFGSVVMLTQTSVKVSLAYSTIAQMGFMILQCGLGAFSAALLHIVAHSLYKAHAFLSSGSVIDLARASWSPSPGGQPHPARMLLGTGAVLLVTLAPAMLFGASPTEKPGVFALGAIMLFGLAHLIAQAIDERPNSYVIGRTLAVATAVASVYFTLQRLTELLLAGSLPPTQALRGPVDLAIVVLVVLSFGALTVFQSLLARHAGEPRWQALYVHVANGFYVNTLTNRLVLRFWPAGPARPDNSASSLTHELGAQP
ncbi:MAG: NADH-quinone oxidoreductase subunit L [Geminicoccaceae bacterium]